MKRIFTVLALIACISFASAQTQPKAAAKTETKKEETCKKGQGCCKDKEQATATTTKSSVKKN